MFKFRLVEREDPAQRGLGGKLYATPIYQGIMGMPEVAKEISGRSTTTYPDILSVLQNFLEFLPFLMKLGYGIRLNDFGVLRIAFSSEGVDDPEEFDVSKIKRPRVTFLTSNNLREEIRNIKYSIVK